MAETSENHDPLVAAVQAGDAVTVSRLLDDEPAKLHMRLGPYEHTLLHAAAQGGQGAIVELLLQRGVDPNVLESGDRTTQMHWAAARGDLAMVQRLVDAGGDVVGSGDDHDLGVIGWASCWDGCDDDAHRAVAEFLVSRGARHHIFSAMALGLEDEVRRIVAADPGELNRRRSRNENHQTPLQFAVDKNLPAMAKLLLDLGADPLAVDGTGLSVAAYATSETADAPVMEAIHKLTLAELDSARRGHRSANVALNDLVAALAMNDWDTAEQVLQADAGLVNAGALHIMAKRNAVDAMRWLLSRGANPDALWAHWDSMVAPLHLAILANHPEAVRALIDAGANTSIRDTKHDGDAKGWAEFFGRQDLMAIMHDS
jgi:ankyrin repeat protein